MIEINLQDHVSPALLQAAQKLPGVVERALDAGTDVIEQEAARQEGKIAQRPIPRSATGRLLWKRTGELARSRKRQKAPLQRTVLWQAPYARPRFALGYERMPQNPAGGIIRRNRVPVDTMKIVEPQLRSVIEQEIENGLGL